MTERWRHWVGALLAACLSAPAFAADYGGPLFDAHLHYNELIDEFCLENEQSYERMLRSRPQ